MRERRSVPVIVLDHLVAAASVPRRLLRGRPGPGSPGRPFRPAVAAGVAVALLGTGLLIAAFLWPSVA